MCDVKCSISVFGKSFKNSKKLTGNQRKWWRFL